MKHTRFITALLALSAAAGLNAAPSKPVPAELKAWANEVLEEISLEKSTSEIASQLAKHPEKSAQKERVLVASAPEALDNKVPIVPATFSLELSVDCSESFIPEVTLKVAQPEAKAPRVSKPSQA